MNAEAVVPEYGQAVQLGITAPEAAFTISAELFGCADWTVTEAGADGFEASAARCLLCAMVKKAGGPGPCRILCLEDRDPSLVRADAFSPKSRNYPLARGYGEARG